MNVTELMSKTEFDGTVLQYGELSSARSNALS